jgi:glycosyltransferase involved in cell wall biosynthesis
MCQERHPEDFDWIDRAVDVGNGRDFEPMDTGDGACELARPWIGDVLPVYVYDEYEGFTAKRFVGMSDAELDSYNERNIEALSSVIEAFQPDAIVTGHEVMGPYIAARACGDRSYVAKLHGSALEYAVKEDPDRFLPYATEGLGRSAYVTGGSRYMLDEAASVIPGWQERGRIVSPGVDIALFQPQEPEARSRPVVGFVGKLISNKGVQDLFMALGLIERPVECVIVGFGDMESRLRALADAIAARDIGGALAALSAEDLRESHAHELLSGPEGRDIIDRASRSEIRFTGRLEHEPLSKVLPTFDILVVPSILAEAFGMVAAEAAACAVVPVVPDHSGIGEVGRILEDEVKRPDLCVYPRELRSGGIAERLDALSDLPDGELRRIGLEMAGVTRRRWTWEKCAADLLALCLEG